MSKIFAVIIFFSLGCTTPPVSYPLNKPIDLALKVEVYKYGALQGTGSGFIAKTTNNKAYVVTNKHVCHDDTSNYILIDHTLGRYNGIYVATHDTADLCLLQIIDNFVKVPIIYGTTKYNDHILSIGAPHGAFPIVKDGYVRHAILVNLTIDRIHYFFRAYAMSLDAECGSSGSPVFNDSNQIVGVVFATLDGKLSYMVPANIVSDFISNYN